MPEGQQQPSGFGGTLKAKLGPLPTWAWLAIITVVLLGYWLYEQHKASASGSQQPATPGTVGQPGVVVINQDEPPGTEPPEPPETKHGKRKDKDGTTRKITVEQNETLGELAKQRHWSDATLKAVEEMNVTQGQGEWTSSTRLKKGETVVRPLRS